MGAIIGLIQKFFPGTFAVNNGLMAGRHEKYKMQLATLVDLLSRVLDEKVLYKYEANGRAVVIRSEIEIIARMTIHPKGGLHRTTYVRVRTEKVTLIAWFQLAFVSMKVRVVPLGSELLLSRDTPRDR